MQARIGVQLQTTSLFDRLTARELLELFAALLPAPRRGRAGRSIALALVGLESKADDTVTRLSGGQQQRLAIALALVHDPELVFLDEPTTGLDPQARHNLWDVIRSINGEQGKTVVLTTHYLEEAEQLCDRVAIMDEARIVALDTPGRADRVARRRRARRPTPMRAATTRSTPRTRRRRCSRCSSGPRDRAAHAGAEGLSVKGADLEDVFLQLTGREYRE